MTGRDAYMDHLLDAWASPDPCCTTGRRCGEADRLWQAWRDSIRTGVLAATS